MEDASAPLSLSLSLTHARARGVGAATARSRRRTSTAWSRRFARTHLLKDGVVLGLELSSAFNPLSRSAFKAFRLAIFDRTEKPRRTEVPPDPQPRSSPTADDRPSSTTGRPLPGSWLPLAFAQLAFESGIQRLSSKTRFREGKVRGARTERHGGLEGGEGLAPVASDPPMIYGRRRPSGPTSPRPDYERSLRSWWKEYSDRKNADEEEHPCDSLYYDRNTLPRTVPRGDCGTS